MPIYEYYCPENHRIYSFLAPSSSFRNRVPKCPDNPKSKLQKRVSRFAIGKGAEAADGEDPEDPFAGVDEGKLAGLVEDMERELAAADSENPDPRQLGKAMRTLTQAMGGKMPGAMDEMLSRLEKGEDPDALEAEYGDAFDDAEFEMGKALKKMIRGEFSKPSQDPELYDITEYL